ncbi:unnamed protein product, partial [Nesidiocoris tenuis]
TSRRIRDTSEENLVSLCFHRQNPFGSMPVEVHGRAIGSERLSSALTSRS